MKNTFYIFSTFFFAFCFYTKNVFSQNECKFFRWKSFNIEKVDSSDWEVDSIFVMSRISYKQKYDKKTIFIFQDTTLTCVGDSIIFSILNELTKESLKSFQHFDKIAYGFVVVKDTTQEQGLYWIKESFIFKKDIKLSREGGLGNPKPQYFVLEYKNLSLTWLVKSNHVLVVSKRDGFPPMHWRLIKWNGIWEEKILDPGINPDPWGLGVRKPPRPLDSDLDNLEELLKLLKN